MFVDRAKITLKAGDGGDGAVHFHREKYVAAGGPDGGDGGKGGDIIFQVDDHLSTLADFRYKRKYAAPRGENGGANRSSGKTGQSLLLKVPRGTLVKDADTGRIIADMSEDEPVVIAKGGRGGWGNSHFATATRQCPRFAKSGIPGEELEVVLELKLLADVGLVGFPNVGKSTLLSVVSQAVPKIANYHFTTLTPVLGVVSVGDTSFVMADIPGLIEGAGEGAGLGHEFLRHVERCRMLIHVVDVSGSEGRDPVEDFETINRELSVYNPELVNRPQIVAANKCDLASPKQLEAFQDYLAKREIPCFPIVAAIAEGTGKLLNHAAAMLNTLPPIKKYEPEPVPELPKEESRAFAVRNENGVYVIDAPWLLSILRDVNPDDYESLQYFQRTLIQSGIIDALKEKGVQEGDTVRVGEIEFDYID